MSHSYLVVCQYRKCGAKTIRKSPRQKYCNLTCSNREQYEKYKERSRTESASTIALHEAVSTAAHTIRSIDDLPGVQVDPAKDTEDFLRSFKESNPAQGLEPATPTIDLQPDSVEVSRPSVLTGEELAKAKKLQEENRLLALVKQERAEKKRQKLLARGRELDQKEEHSTTKSNEELKREVDNRWVEKDDPDV